MRIPLNNPPVSGQELNYISDVLERRKFSGDGYYTNLCQERLRKNIGSGAVRLTHSCTAALEMTAILANVTRGDEVIMPSFTFVSTANAFVLRAATPVFVDIEPDTLNIDPIRIEEAITARTRAIVVVHYAGVCADMDPIRQLARAHDLIVIEDAAQAISSRYKGLAAGSMGEMACFSFHETKNIVSGEGGALVVNDVRLLERADVIWEKGTNRKAFRNRTVNKYTWVDIGSSYLPSEITAAFLYAQLEASEQVIASRIRLWDRYHAAFATLEEQRVLRRPVVPTHCLHNGHMYYLLLPTRAVRDRMIGAMAKEGILAPFHYVPLHSSPAGLRYGRASGNLSITDSASERLLRLPLYSDLSNEEQGQVIDCVLKHIAETINIA